MRHFIFCLISVVLIIIVSGCVSQTSHENYSERDGNYTPDISNGYEVELSIIAATNSFGIGSPASDPYSAGLVINIDFAPDKKIKFCMNISNRREEFEDREKNKVGFGFRTRGDLAEYINLSLQEKIYLYQDEYVELNYTVKLPEKLDPGTYRTSFLASFEYRVRFPYYPYGGEVEIIERDEEKEMGIGIVVNVPGGNGTSPDVPLPEF